MRRAAWYMALCVLASGLVIVACGYEREKAPEEQAGVSTMEESLPDPGPEEAGQVEDAVRQWVAERANEEGIYAIPARGGHEVSGTLAAFHTVHQKDANTYAVCVDFQDGESTHDVDFLVYREGEDLTVSNHYLHKAGGEELM